MHLKPTSKIWLILIVGFCLIISLVSLSEATEEYAKNEKNSLVEFRKLMKNDLYLEYMKSDVYLIRWLRAKKFNLEDSAKMLRTALKWRKENQIDTIVGENILEFQSPPYYIDGIDFEQSTILAIIAGRVDMRRLILAGKKDALVRWFDQIMEDFETKLMKRVTANETVIGSKDHLITSLVDMSGYNIRQHSCLSCIQVYLTWFEHIENYYPGYTKHFIYINAPRIFSPVLALIKPILAIQTRDALQLFGSNRNEWLGVIQKIVPADQVGANFGGTKSD